MEHWGEMCTLAYISRSVSSWVWGSKALTWIFKLLNSAIQQTVDQNSLAGCTDKREAAPSFCPFALVESLPVAKVIIREPERRFSSRGDIDRVLLAQGRVRTWVSRIWTRSRWATMTARSKLRGQMGKLHPTFVHLPVRQSRACW